MKPYISIVSIKVTDQDRAKKFFMDNFGWVCTSDVTMGDYRWLAVGPTDEEGRTSIQLSKEDAAGDVTDIIIECDDVMKTAEALKAKGVKITEEPFTESWGGFAKFKDSEGNEYGLHSTAK